jgi:hypothetical protein
MTWIETHNQTLKMVGHASSVILIILYSTIHAATLYEGSRIDQAYLLILSLSGAVLILSSVTRNRTVAVVKVNVVIVLAFALIFEFAFSIGLVANAAISPILFGKTSADSAASVIERLSFSPWFKFKERVVVTSRGERGPDFVYRWETDSNGFKNPPLTGERSHHAYLALGNSFTEGMGVSIEDTWASIFQSKTGKTVYNAGVQGYAPSQFLGTMHLLKDRIEFDVVVLGHLPAIYQREENFGTVPTQATGGIESIRVGRKAQLVVPQVIKRSIALMRSSLAAAHRGGPGSRFSEYRTEIPATIPSSAQVLSNPNWGRAMEAYFAIAEWCRINDKRLVIIGFPRRYEVYFGRAESIHSSEYYLELDLLRQALSGFDFTLVDTYPALRRYAARAASGELPYFEVDGHLSRWGNQIVAESLVLGLQ